MQGTPLCQFIYMINKFSSLSPFPYYCISYTWDYAIAAGYPTIWSKGGWMEGSGYAWCNAGKINITYQTTAVIVLWKWLMIVYLHSDVIVLDIWPCWKTSVWQKWWRNNYYNSWQISILFKIVDEPTSNRKSGKRHSWFCHLPVLWMGVIIWLVLQLYLN